MLTSDASGNALLIPRAGAAGAPSSGAKRTFGAPKLGRLQYCLLWLSLCGCYSAGTLRVLDNRDTLGPRIPELAYAAYLAGSLAEHQGDLEGAQALYKQALTAFKSVELFTSAARVECELGNFNAAERSFQAAEILDPSYPTLFHDRAQCRLKHKQPKLALADALNAEALAPDDARATQVTAAAFSALGQPEDAQRHLTAYAVLHPNQRQNPAPIERAVQRGQTLMRGDSAELFCSPAAIAALISKADDTQLQHVVTECRVSAAELATSALHLGRAKLALLLSQQALHLSPNRADTRALVLLSAVRSGQFDAALLQLSALPVVTTPLSATGAAQLRELDVLLDGRDALVQGSAVPALRP